MVQNGNIGREKQEAGSPEGLPGEHLVGEPGRPADPEVGNTIKRRRFLRAYKIKILKEADRCDDSGQIGMLLRREGLYSSTLTNWRRWRETMGEKSSQNKRVKNRELINENARLKRQVDQLTLKLKKSEGIIDLQKKISEVLEANLPVDEPDENAS